MIQLCALTLGLQADSQVDHVRQHFYEVSLEYVFKVQEVQERKMFEFVEPVKTDTLHIMGFPCNACIMYGLLDWI